MESVPFSEREKEKDGGRGRLMSLVQTLVEANEPRTGTLSLSGRMNQPDVLTSIRYA